MYINDALKTPTLARTLEIERRILFSENSSVVSVEWRPGVSAGILK
jgi:hypothetical protein